MMAEHEVALNQGPRHADGVGSNPDLRAQDRQDYVIGEFYRVPAVRVLKWRFFLNGWLPIIGPQHEDAEIINYPWQHYHIDWRFAPERAVRDALMGRGGNQSFLYATPVMCSDTARARIIIEGPLLKRMKCKREWPAFPRQPLIGKGWPDALREKYACARLINGKCPHRGIPVSAMRRDGDILECPAHGLRWNSITGEAA
jgi:hypothetical protein